MLEYREEQSLLELEALASQASMGAKFRVFTRALPSTIIPDSMGAYTFKGCTHYIARTRRFCKRLVGVRRGLFAENATKKSHAGPCSVEGTHFYRFIVELQDGSGTIFAVIGDSVAYLLGTSLPFPAHEFVTLGPRSKANLFATVSVREFYFHLQFTMSQKGVGSWSILKCSSFPLHTLITPYQSPANSGPSPEAQTESSRVPGVLLVPDGSPLTRLLDIQPRRNPLNGLPADCFEQFLCIVRGTETSAS